MQTDTHKSQIYSTATKLQSAHICATECQKLTITYTNNEQTGKSHSKTDTKFTSQDMLLNASNS